MPRFFLSSCLSFSVALVIPIYAAPDRCNDILRENGAFNTLIRTSSYSGAEQTYEWLRTATWREFSDKQDAGLSVTLPMDGAPVPINGKYTKEQFEKFAEARDQGKIRFFTQQEFESTVVKTASPEIAKRWSQCMMANRDPHGLTCWAIDDEQESGTVIFNARYFADDKNAKVPTVVPGGLTVVNAKIVDKINALDANKPVPLGGTNVTLQRAGRKGITITLRTTKGLCSPSAVVVDALPDPVKIPDPPLPIEVAVFSVTSGTKGHPMAAATVGQGYKVIGGGALANWSDKGSLLIASYPSGNSWIAQSKDHVYVEATTITAWAIGLYDPRDEWDVKVVPAPVVANEESRSTASASLPPGYTMTGGGAVTSPDTIGILLSASFPAGATTWEARAHDHTAKASGTLTAYVIGIKAKKGETPKSQVWPATSTSQPHPSCNASIPSGWWLTGGGAQTQSDINLLTASFPFDLLTWRAEAKDHIVPSPTTVTVYAIGMKPGPGSSFSPAEMTYAYPSFPGRYALAAGITAPRVRVASKSRATYYVTRRTDTLRRIAMRFYQNENWQKILEANRAVISDPRRVKTGTILVIPQ